jgi:hypothetical protein
MWNRACCNRRGPPRINGPPSIVEVTQHQEAPSQSHASLSRGASFLSANIDTLQQISEITLDSSCNYGDLDQVLVTNEALEESALLLKSRQTMGDREELSDVSVDSQYSQMQMQQKNPAQSTV